MKNNMFYDAGDGGGGGENSTIRELRDQIKSLEGSLKDVQSSLEAEKSKSTELSAKVKEAEQSKMGDIERLQAQLKEAESEASKVEGLQKQLEQAKQNAEGLGSTVETIYKARLESIEDEGVRGRVEKLTSNGDWGTRLSALDDALGLVMPPTAPSNGTTNQPPAGTGANSQPPTSGGRKTDGEAPKVDEKTIGQKPWGELFGKQPAGAGKE